MVSQIMNKNKWRWHLKMNNSIGFFSFKNTSTVNYKSIFLNSVLRIITLSIGEMYGFL